MIANRSVPSNVMIAHVVYQDVPAAIEWLTAHFGFIEHYRYGSPDSGGAQMRFGTAVLMLTSARPKRASPLQSGAGSQSLTLFPEDVEKHYAHTRSTGAKIVEELNETSYGERQYGVEDLEGHHWLFSNHARDVNPADWGATVSTPAD